MGDETLFPMVANYEWDDAKAALNLIKHGVSFLDATEVFEDPRKVLLDVTRSADGEMRWKIVGRFESRLLAVVYTERGEACRLISARPTNRSEEKAYDDRAIRP